MKKYFWLLTLFLFFLSLYFVVDAYGLFETEYKASIIQDVGRWSIKLNNADISKGILENFDIQNFYYDTNANVSEGYIAPGSKGYFDITIDPSGTDVAIKYNILIDLTSEYPSNIKMSVEDLTGGNATLVGENEYSGIVNLDDILVNETITIRVNIEWLNDENYNENDNILGSSDNEIIIPVRVNIKQYLGETIE